MSTNNECGNETLPRQETQVLSLPTEENKEEQKKQKTYQILNNAMAGKGVVQVAYFPQEENELTSSPPSNLFADTVIDKPKNKFELQSINFCCSGLQHCKMKTPADPSKHLCPICLKPVHVICGVLNPDFQKDIVSFKYSTICMKCHERKSNPTSLLKKVSQKPKEGIAYKRYDGKWWVCINEKEPFMVDQSDLMDSKKFFVTQVGSTFYYALSSSRQSLEFSEISTTSSSG